MISDKRIRESAYPVQMLLQTLRYVVKWAETADEDFNLHRDERIDGWIETLKSGRDDILNLKKYDFDKSLRSVDRLCFETTKDFFAEREVIYVIYTMYHVLNDLITADKWKIPERAEDSFYSVWGELGPYMEKQHGQMLEGSEKSARKMAGKIVNWLNVRGMYQ